MRSMRIYAILFYHAVLYERQEHYTYFGDANHEIITGKDHDGITHSTSSMRKSSVSVFHGFFKDIVGRASHRP